MPGARPLARLSLAPLLIAAAATAGAACPPDAEVEPRAAAFAAGETFAPYPTELSLDDAYCAQRKYVARLTDAYGEPAGYKVAFTGEAAQRRFGVSGPARGVLLAGMLRPDGATLPADFAPRPLIEADLLVTVADDAIMVARTVTEVAAHLGEVRPFLELPAIPLHPDAEVDGRQLIAFNAGARAGVQGPGIPVRATPEFIAALAAMETTLTGANGEVLATARGEALMGQPLRALLWLIEDLRANGESLEAGDVVSLGSLTAPLPIEAGTTYTLTYTGLPGGPLRTSVTIEVSE